MGQVARTGVSLVITKRGVPVARLVPVADFPASVFGFAKGAFAELDEIISPTTRGWRPDPSEVRLLEGHAVPRKSP
jgi:antitoxin (DNA-binding transcriptional repressor) of toxin-antitoxin stability system